MAALESYWNTQSDTLRDIRDQLGYERYPTRQYKPLPDRHPLLKNGPTIHKRRAAPKPRVTRTPPAHNVRTYTPPTQRYTPPTGHRHSPDLRGAKYDVIPPLKPRKAFPSPVPDRPPRDDDSWGETDDESDEDDNPMTSYHGFPPYPMVMYPAYPMMMAPQPQYSSRKKSKKDGKSKKKVHYRNTPTYLSSREHTKHSPRNSVLDRYNVPQSSSRSKPLSASHPLYPSSFFYCEDFLDAEIPKIVREVVDEASYNIVDGHLQHKLEKYDPLEDFLTELVNEAITMETTGVVKEVAKDIVEEHMEKAGAYDEILDMTGQLIQEIAPGVVEEALLENMLEDLIRDELIDPEIEAECQDLAVETLTHYSNKVRTRDVRELKKTTSDKLKDSMMLDYLLAYIARQGELWTQGEHVNKLLDEIALNIILTEYLSVGQKRRATVENKPVRRYYEKMVTDVTLDVLLEEISQSLDEDMADLDEYEQEIENPDINYEMPKDLKKWLDGR